MTEVVDGPDDPAGKEKKKAKVRNVWISFAGRIVAQVIGAVASVVLGIMVLQRYQDRPASPEPLPTQAASRISPARTSGHPAIAVLPLDNFSGHPEDAYFADGMTEALIADLAQIKGLRSRTSTQQCKGSKKPLPVVAQELNAGGGALVPPRPRAQLELPNRARMARHPARRAGS